MCSPTSYFKAHISGTLRAIKANVDPLLLEALLQQLPGNETFRPYHKGDTGASPQNFQSHGSLPKMAVLTKHVSQDQRELQTSSVGIY